MTQVVEYLPSKHEALNSTSVPDKEILRIFFDKGKELLLAESLSSEEIGLVFYFPR
jgi:hypothetical protein